MLRSLLKLSERDGPVIFGFLTFEHPKHMLKRIDKNYEHFYDHVFLRSYPFFFFFFFFFFLLSRSMISQNTIAALSCKGFSYFDTYQF